MEYSIKRGTIEKQQTHCLVLGYFEKQKLAPCTTEMDAALGGWLKSMLQHQGCKGKPGETLFLPSVPDSKAERILLVGFGKQGDISTRDFSKGLKAAVGTLAKINIKNALVTLTEIEVKNCTLLSKSRQIVEHTENNLYKFNQLKSKKEETVTSFQHLKFFLTQEKQRTAVETGIAQGQAIADGMGIAKDLANLPGNLCTPSDMAKCASQLGKEHKKLKIKILEEAQMEKLGMGGLLSVSKGSEQPAKMIIMEYKGAAKAKKPIALVGKGLTFDAGGISLKPSAAMDEMKYDMCGGASVIGTIAAIANLDLPINVVGIVPSSENLPDGKANKPGDIVTSMSGKTIEILNTDAEGRLILCDALTYAERYDPVAVIDIATLTGACVVALGHHASGLLGNEDTLCDELIKAGDQSNDRLWRLPLWEEYQAQLDSNFADMANIGGRDAGTITAACFLSRYTRKFKWAHIDIAGTAWKSGKQKGATGRPVPLLTQFLINQA